nr:hypothetical protein [uncultured Acetatifactor sp.]
MDTGLWGESEDTRCGRHAGAAGRWVEGKEAKESAQRRDREGLWKESAGD